MALLSASHLRCSYSSNHRNIVKAVDGVSFEIEAGETLGLVGESGCGKSTLSRALLRLIPSSGQIRFAGTDVATLSEREFRPFRSRIQMVFQDPFTSLNPRRTIGETLAAPLKAHGRGGRRERAALVRDMLERVGLENAAAKRYPHEFSGGQRQRIAIARALILKPQLVICDEPVSALDLSLQAQVLNLLNEMKRLSGLSYLFISHDLSVVTYMADRILVMFRGRIVESGPTANLSRRPRHPYTQLLLTAVPGRFRPGSRELAFSAEAGPRDAVPAGGCAYHFRCPLADATCTAEEPALRDMGDGQFVACHHATE